MWCMRISNDSCSALDLIDCLDRIIIAILKRRREDQVVHLSKARQGTDRPTGSAD